MQVVGNAQPLESRGEQGLDPAGQTVGHIPGQSLLSDPKVLRTQVSGDLQPP